MAISFEKLYFVEPSPVARRVLWHAWSVGSVFRDEPERHEGFDKPGWFLFWVVSGAGTLELADRSFELKPGPRCWLLDLRQPRAYLPKPGRKLVTASVRFSGLGVDVWREVLGTEAEFVFEQAGDRSFLSKAHRQILALVRRRPAGYEWRIHHILNEVLGLLLRVRGAMELSQGATPEPVRKVIEAVLADPTRAWRAKELGALAGVSYSALRSRFKETQHESLHEFLQRTRLDQARLLLSDQRLSIKQVAQQLHCSSDVYFSHFFRRATGLTPGEFRQTSRA
jgi:AraC-like DNA-binding protein